MEKLDKPYEQLGFCPVGIEKPLGVSELGNALKVVLGKISGINQGG